MQPNFVIENELVSTRETTGNEIENNLQSCIPSLTIFTDVVDIVWYFYFFNLPETYSNHCQLLMYTLVRLLQITNRLTKNGLTMYIDSFII